MIKGENEKIKIIIALNFERKIKCQMKRGTTQNYRYHSSSQSSRVTYVKLTSLLMTIISNSFKSLEYKGM
jgi:hypothetical protein